MTILPKNPTFEPRLGAKVIYRGYDAALFDKEFTIVKKITDNLVVIGFLDKTLYAADTCIVLTKHLAPLGHVALATTKPESIEVQLCLFPA